jgi:peptidase A4-like protein
MRKLASAGALAAMAFSCALALAPAASASPARAGGPVAADPPSLGGKLLATGAKNLTRVQPGGPVSFTGEAPSFGRSSRYSTQNVISNNWGGYAAARHGTKFRFIQATFFVPYINCMNTPDSFSGHWVGLDGFSSASVEQDGILAECNGTAPEYLAWYEMFPLAPVYKSVTVQPGDSVVASVYFNSGTNKFALTLKDTTNGQSFTVNKTCPAHVTCSRSSAEAISEAPSNGNSILPLTDFGAEGYSSIRATDRAGQRGGLRAANWDTFAITTENPSAVVLDQPTQISRGSAFGMYWMASQ